MGPKIAKKPTFLPRSFPFMSSISSHSLSLLSKPPLSLPSAFQPPSPPQEANTATVQPQQPPVLSPYRFSSFTFFLPQPPPFAPRCPPPPSEPPHVNLPPPFFFFFVPVVHCVNSKRELIHAFCSCMNSGILPRIFFFSQVRPSHKNFQKKILFFHLFCYGILLNIDLYLIP